MKKTIILLTTLLLISGCRSVEKNTKKNKESVDVDASVTAIKTESATSSYSSATTKTTTEETNGVASIPEKTSSVSATEKELNSGKTIKTETADQVVEIQKDLKTGVTRAMATTKAKDIPINNKKTTIENTTAGGETQYTSLHLLSEMLSLKKDIENSVKEQRREADVKFYVMLSLILIMLIVLLVSYYVKKKSG